MIDLQNLRDEAVSEELDELHEDIEEDSETMQIEQLSLGARLEVNDE
jgi:hypothetical protein